MRNAIHWIAGITTLLTVTLVGLNANNSPSFNEYESLPPAKVTPYVPEPTPEPSWTPNPIPDWESQWEDADLYLGPNLKATSHSLACVNYFDDPKGAYQFEVDMDSSGAYKEFLAFHKSNCVGEYSEHNAKKILSKQGLY